MCRNDLERISDRTISESDLRFEIKKLGNVTEPPSFWLNITSDQTYSPAHRAVAICQLFKRHVMGPITVADLAKLLNAPDWLNSSNVTTVKHLKGEIPVEWNLGETVFAIRLFPGQVESAPVLYLRLSQTLEAETFVQMIRSRGADCTAVDARVLQAACDG
jgi:hypothetical protein